MPITITAESELIVGTALVVEAQAPQEPFVAVFEDDGDTGYFYALDTSLDDNPIQDALHIYDASNVADKQRPSEIKIGWSQDSKKVVLLINGHPHAVFDFEAKRGYCRTGFPPAPDDSPWGVHGHAWSDAAVELFAQQPVSGRLDAESLRRVRRHRVTSVYPVRPLPASDRRRTGQQTAVSLRRHELMRSARRGRAPR